MVYCEVQFARGTGFGNKLFPWARCKIFSELHQVPMLAPVWFNPRIGPLLRGGIDLSAYHHQILLSGLFARSGENYVSGYRRLITKSRAQRVSEPNDLRSNDFRGYADRVLVSFKGEKRHFVDVE